MKEHFKGWIRTLPDSSMFWITLLGIVLVSGILALFLGWSWIRSGSNETEPNSTTIRNVSLVIGGVLALVFAVWRSAVAQRQAETAQRGLLNERYQRGAEMLGSDALSVRVGGVYALSHLAEEHPEQYHVPVMELFCACACHPTGQFRTTDAEREIVTEMGPEQDHHDPYPMLRADVQSVMAAIGTRDKRRINLENRSGYRLNLRHADLRGGRLPNVNLAYADLTGAKLSGVNLWDAKLYQAKLIDADLSCPPNTKEDRDYAITGLALEAVNQSPITVMIYVDLSDTDLSGADLSNVSLACANFSGAQLYGTVFSGADLSQARFSMGGQNPADGMTQTDLDEACADTRIGPELEGVDDPETGEPLVWRG